MMETCHPQQDAPQTSSETSKNKVISKRRRRSAGAGLFLTRYDCNVDFDVLEAESKSTPIRAKSKRLENRVRKETSANVIFTTDCMSRDKRNDLLPPSKSTLYSITESNPFQKQSNDRVLQTESQPSQCSESTVNVNTSAPVEYKELKLPNKNHNHTTSLTDASDQRNTCSSQLLPSLPREKTPLTIPLLSADVLSQRCKELFGCNEPCILSNLSAKIFAYASLLLDPESTSVLLSSSFLSMLASFVNIETTLIQEAVNSSIEAQHDDYLEISGTRKRVRFCPFSSISPPTDIKFGSSLLQERCIKALKVSVEKVDEFCLGLNEAEWQRVVQCLEKLVVTLRHIEESSQNHLLWPAFKHGDDNQDNGLWYESSFPKVVRRHRIELQEIHSFFLFKFKAHTNGTAFLMSPSRKQLVEQIGVAIRFHLRRLLNPVPLTPTNTESTKLPQSIPDYSSCRSRVHQLVQMVACTDDRDTAAADGSISSVFNLAIQYIYSYFDFSSNKILIPGTNNANTTSIDAMKNDCTKSSSLPIFPANFDALPIIDSVRKFHDVLATGKACKFVIALLDWPGVLEAINDVGGWGPVENLSSLLSKHNLDKICPEYAHFQILNNMHLFVETMKLSMTCIEETMATIENNLRIIWERFKCGTKKKTWLRRNPFVIMIRDAIMTNGVVFPSLECPTE